MLTTILSVFLITQFLAFVFMVMACRIAATADRRAIRPYAMPLPSRESLYTSLGKHR